MEKKLPYLTKPLGLANGNVVEEFDIPDEDREIVLRQLYPFTPYQLGSFSFLKWAHFLLQKTSEDVRYPC